MNKVYGCSSFPAGRDQRGVPFSGQGSLNYRLVANGGKPRYVVKFGSSPDYHDCKVFNNYLAITESWPGMIRNDATLST